jgi:hypothetical protein
MNYGQVKAQFQAVLNRRDITPTLTENFVQQAIQRAQRVLRVPAMEKSVEIETPANELSVDVPGDLLGVINILWQDSSGYWHKLSRRDLGYVYSQRQMVGNAAYYAREGGVFVLAPQPITAGKIRIDYFCNFANLSADADTNWLTEIAADVIIYGALSFAADYYLDNRRDAFEQRFVAALDELLTQMQLDELSAGAAISPAYGMNYRNYD